MHWNSLPMLTLLICVNICLYWMKQKKKAHVMCTLKVTSGHGVQTEQRNRKKKHCLIIKNSIVKDGSSEMTLKPSSHCPRCTKFCLRYGVLSLTILLLYSHRLLLDGLSILHIIDSSQGVRGKL